MYQCITFPSDFTPFLQELVLGFSVAAYEGLLYPLDLLASRCIARENNFSKSILNYRESYILYKESRIIVQKSQYHGLRSRMDMSISKIVLRYYCFNNLYYRYAFQPLEQTFDNEPEQLFNLTPDSPSIHPLLTYLDIKDPKVLLIAAISNLVGLVGSQPINVLRVRLQNENLSIAINKSYNGRMRDIINEHQSQWVWFKAGFGSRFVYTYLQFLGELGLFQYCLQSMNCEFINTQSANQEYHENFIKLGGAVTLCSLITSIVGQPFYFYSQRYCLYFLKKQHKQIKGLTYFKQVYNHEGFEGFTKGLWQNCVRSVGRNTICVGVLWFYAKFANRERFRPEE